MFAMRKAVLAAALSCGAATAAHAAALTGVSDRNPIGYRAGEEMVFTLTPKGGERVRWIRTGDDGREEKGEAPASAPVVLRTSLDRPGFVRIVAELLGGDGERLARFDGGAGADVAAIRQDKEEPANFDAFWARRRQILSAVPMDGATCREIASGRDDVRLYEISVPCAGPRPATGFLSVPAAPGRYPAHIRFHGYNASWTKAARTPPPSDTLRADRLTLLLSAHGYELGRDAGYYKELRAQCGSNGYDYAFDPAQNADPDKAYFCGMAFRVMRGLEYLKSRPEWDGRTLVAEGGSMGGLQSIWAAALDGDVTECRPYIPWCCNIAGPESGRAHGDWHVAWTPALGYYDAANMARRIPATCRTIVTRAGLGDYICPPSGVMAFYNNLACPKRITFVQGATHFAMPPKPRQTAELDRGISPWRVPSWDARLTAPGLLGSRSYHVQGMCVASNALYFAMYDQLAKTDWMGRAVKSVPVPKHTGDICLWRGRIYAACCAERGDPSPEKGCIRVYDEDLNFLRERRFERPADGITCIGGVLYVGLGPGGTKAEPCRGNWYGRFDAESLEPLGEPVRIDHGHDCCAGVQNMATDGEHLFVSVYTPDERAQTPDFIVFDRDFNVLALHRFAHRQGLDVVPGGDATAVRFIYATTVNWMERPKGDDAPPVQALWQFAEMKDGRIRDITRHCIYRKPWDRGDGE